MQNETEDFALSQGLQGQDDNIEMLLKLWDELQSSSVDVAQAPVPNLFAFAESAFFFAVIMQKKKPDAKADKGNAKQMNMSFDAPAHSGPVNLFEKNYRDESRFGPSSTGEVMVPIDTEHAPEVFSTDEWDTIVADAELAGAYRDLHHYPSSHPNVYEIPDMGISSAVSPFNKFLSPPTQSPIGLLYLTSTPHTYAPAGEMNIGIVLDAASRGRGYARQAIELVLTWVFEDVKFHRVQAAILDPSSRPRALTLFTQMCVHKFSDPGMFITSNLHI
jgi:hypothetical protein